jgi:hypothetical protein
MEISYEKNSQGAWVLTTIYQNRYVRQAYFFYTKKEATQQFRQFVKGEN